MPLPPALLARLAKRGIVEEAEQAKNANKSGSEEVEEVFAEDYDDPSKLDVEEEMVPPPVIPQPPQPKIREEEPVYRETTACPFRVNPYHTCVPYCRRRYGLKEWKPDAKMLKRRERMLTKYPLPEGWIEVGDSDTCRYYYWNIHTDEVSWLSPTHPKTEISQSAEQLGIVGKIGNLDSDGEEAMVTSEPEDNAPEKSDSDTSLSDEEDYEEKIESRLFKGPPALSKQDMKKSRGKAEELDPMDPAAYSDVARGGWSDGLDMRGKAKTGVDETASGPLFQQRPYPSPGDILRANQSIKKKK